MMDNDKMIGYRIATALDRKGKHQKDLAKELGVKDNVISYFCGGKRKPNLQQLVLISKYLGVTTDYLLGLDDNPTIDLDLLNACKYTGLSVDSVNALRSMPDEERGDAEIEIINELLSSNGFWWLVNTIYGLKLSMKGIYFSHDCTDDYLKVRQETRLAYLDVVEALPEMIDELYGYHKFIKNLPMVFKNLDDTELGKMLLQEMQEEGE